MQRNKLAGGLANELVNSAERVALLEDRLQRALIIVDAAEKWAHNASTMTGDEADGQRLADALKAHAAAARGNACE